MTLDPYSFDAVSKALNCHLVTAVTKHLNFTKTLGITKERHIINGSYMTPDPCPFHVVPKILHRHCLSKLDQIPRAVDLISLKLTHRDVESLI